MLAIGLAPTDSNRTLAELMDLDLNEFGYFAAAGVETPFESSRRGVFLAGACSGPTDIQGSRKQAMALAGRLAQRLSATDKTPVASAGQLNEVRR